MARCREPAAGGGSDGHGQQARATGWRISPRVNCACRVRPGSSPRSSRPCARTQSAPAAVSGRHQRDERGGPEQPPGGAEALADRGVGGRRPGARAGSCRRPASRSPPPAGRAPAARLVAGAGPLLRRPPHRHGEEQAERHAQPEKRAAQQAPGLGPAERDDHGPRGRPAGCRPGPCGRSWARSSVPPSPTSSDRRRRPTTGPSATRRPRRRGPRPGRRTGPRRSPRPGGRPRPRITSRSAGSQVATARPRGRQRREGCERAGRRRGS